MRARRNPCGSGATTSTDPLEHPAGPAAPRLRGKATDMVDFPSSLLRDYRRLEITAVAMARERATRAPSATTQLTPTVLR
jgi:hypothetical protein